MAIPPNEPGDAAARIDWREKRPKSQRIYVRETPSGKADTERVVWVYGGRLGFDGVNGVTSADYVAGESEWPTKRDRARNRNDILGRRILTEYCDL